MIINIVIVDFIKIMIVIITAIMSKLGSRKISIGFITTTPTVIVNKNIARRVIFITIIRVNRIKQIERWKWKLR